ncbi:Catechol 2,3-dioxygenase [Amycolatopsis arida]|uniref:Catechol 2,3-dioxygenase n=1 Tax=Amycolatopsis arida TaxID=587909 RepID=A0A1I5M9Z3_9PSEU|nr:VOC family protein [Amycolatopsis arida]TDX94023.1 catechol 2,3-dioxygenase-like lactoylglutathione lyase family enzyme [Amycolatopsis arida]SFP06365.1 Catechol 2,3-dioxygenase [Amycolatopsis arida]
MSVARVRYIVDDVDATVDFYVTHLGFDLTVRHAPGVALLVKGALRLLLSTPNGAGGGDRDEVPKPGGWNRIRLEVDDLAAEVRMLQRAGVAIRGESVQDREGQYVVIEDPAGNPVELFEPTDQHTSSC